MRQIIVLLSLLALGGCATGYQPQGFTGGFSETRFDTNVWRVVFNGNARTSNERAADFTLLRCAEIALDHGFSHFVVVDSEKSMTTGSYTTPTQSYTHGNATAYRHGNAVTAHGSSTTTTHGGQTYHYQKPSRSITMVALSERPEGFSYNARMIRDQLMLKYGIQGE
jgi:hypothetical protein